MCTKPSLVAQCKATVKSNAMSTFPNVNVTVAENQQR